MEKTNASIKLKNGPVIVVAHELGHFFLAKKNGVGVPEFSVGMGPRIITFAKTAEGCVVKCNPCESRKIKRFADALPALRIA